MLTYDIYATRRDFVIYISPYFSATFIFLPQSFTELFLLDCLKVSIWLQRWKVAFAQLRSKAFASKTCGWWGWNSPLHQSSNEDTQTRLGLIKLITHNEMLKMEWGWVRKASRSSSICTPPDLLLRLKWLHYKSALSNVIWQITFTLFPRISYGKHLNLKRTHVSSSNAVYKKIERDVAHQSSWHRCLSV